MSTPQNQDAETALKKSANLVYLLQAATFAVTLTYFIAPIVAYWKLKQAQDTWLESHFLWQINTFWFSLAGLVAGILLLYASLPIGIMLLSTTSMWFVYRIGQGWTRLSRKQPMRSAAN